MKSYDPERQLDPLILDVLASGRRVEASDVRAELPRRTEELAQCMAHVAESLRNTISIPGRELPIMDDGRIDPRHYRQSESPQYTDPATRADQKVVEGLLREQGGINIQRDGERLEMYTMVTLNTALQPEYIVIRSSLFDDFQNGVDHLLVNAQTGKVICAFDNVAAAHNENEASEALRDSLLAKKLARISGKNMGGGASVKYGIQITRSDNGKSALVKRPLSGLPIFYIAITADMLHCSLLHSGYTSAKMDLQSADISFLNTIRSSLEAQVISLKHQYAAAKALKPRQDFSAQFTRLEALEELLKRLKKFERKL
jgi:outer membrane murein-binding lipoprotein Lpp